MCVTSPKVNKTFLGIQRPRGDRRTYPTPLSARGRMGSAVQRVRQFLTRSWKQCASEFVGRTLTVPKRQNPLSIGQVRPSPHLGPILHCRHNEEIDLSRSADKEGQAPSVLSLVAPYRICILSLQYHIGLKISLNDFGSGFFIYLPVFQRRYSQNSKLTV